MGRPKQRGKDHHVELQVNSSEDINLDYLQNYEDVYCLLF